MLVATFLPDGFSAELGEVLLPLCVAQGRLSPRFITATVSWTLIWKKTFFFAPAGKLISLKCADVWIICPWTQQICSQQAAPVSAREQSVMPEDV